MVRGGKALTFLKKHDTLTFDTKKAAKRKSIPGFPHQRGDGRCKFLWKRGEGAFEPRSGNAPPVPRRYRDRVRISQIRIQVEPRTFVRPEPKYRLRAFFAVLGPSKGELL